MRGVPRGFPERISACVRVRELTRMTRTTHDSDDSDAQAVGAPVFHVNGDDPEVLAERERERERDRKSGV